VNPEVLELEQGSTEWLEARLGYVTASRFKDVLAITKTGTEFAGRKNYRAEIVVERLTGMSGDRYTNKYMEFGSSTEELARVEYMIRTDNDVTEVGMLRHPTLMAGASPDGLIGEDGGLEIKVQQIANHIEALKTRDIPKQFQDQIHGNLWISGRAWWDYCSYAPELPPNAQLFIQRV
jgi:predicted phage-related endonuclease